MGERKLREGLGETNISEREVGNGGREGWEKERKLRQGLGETKISEREVGNSGGERWETER